MYEFSCAEGDPYYPIPRSENAELYKRYAALAEQTPHVHFVGRLATYKYYNMDQVVAQALTTFSKIVGLPRQDAVVLQAEPKATTLHVPMSGELASREIAPLDAASALTNGINHALTSNGNGRTKVSKAVSGNGNGHARSRRNPKNGSLLSNGNSH